MNATKPQPSAMKWRYFRQSLFFGVVRLAALAVTLALLGIIAFLLVNGFSAISWSFLTLPPADSMTRGGIMPAIVGTFYLTVGAIVVALPPWGGLGDLPDRIRQAGPPNPGHPHRP